MFQLSRQQSRHEPWNKGKLVGQKAPLSMQEIWSIRMRLQGVGNTRDLALFNLAIDSKLRACDVLALRVSDVASNGQVQSRAIVRQRKTKRPVRFEITARTRKSIKEWIDAAKLSESDFLFPSRIHSSAHLSTRQYARIVDAWVMSIGLDTAAYGTHSMRRTKATLIYRRTKNLRAVQLLLGHSNSTVPCAIWGLKLTMRWKYRSRLTYKADMRPSGDGRIQPLERPLSSYNGRQKMTHTSRSHL